ncbi:MAG TPA: DoxX family protein [Planctomycetota bacterium]|jgi:putative oxidoreductase|nr:DoxX family protein [Planctomycetota bacterium]
MPTQLFEPRKEVRTAPGKTTKPSLGVLRRLERLLDTTAELYRTACRLILGFVMLAHGSQKMFGWFGGSGFSGTVQGFREHLGIPTAMAVLVILAEFLGSLGLIFGLLGRVGAGCVIAVMLGAIFLVHAPNGFFMNWSGKAPGEGFEYHLLAIGLALPVLIKGSGALSVDLALVRRLRKDRTNAA